MDNSLQRRIVIRGSQSAVRDILRGVQRRVILQRRPVRRSQRELTQAAAQIAIAQNANEQVAVIQYRRNDSAENQEERFDDLMDMEVLEDEIERPNAGVENASAELGSVDGANDMDIEMVENEVEDEAESSDDEDDASEDDSNDEDEQEDAAMTLESSDDEEAVGMAGEPHPVDPKCPVCYESIANRRPVAMPCGHLFCKLCIKRSLRRKRQCPLCRNEPRPSQLFHKIFLH